MNSSFCRKRAIRSSSRYCFQRRSCSREPWPRGDSPRGTGCRQPCEPCGGKRGTGWDSQGSLQQHLELSSAFCPSVIPQPRWPPTGAPQRGPSLYPTAQGKRDKGGQGITAPWEGGQGRGDGYPTWEPLGAPFAEHRLAQIFNFKPWWCAIADPGVEAQERCPSLL